MKFQIQFFRGRKPINLHSKTFHLKSSMRCCALLLLSTLCLAQQEMPSMPGMDHSHMRTAAGQRIQVEDDPTLHSLTARVGPIALPAHTDHMHAQQLAPQMLTIPIDGWITAYHPSLEDAKGNKVPGRLVHHVAFWNTARSDFLCPTKEEHIFGAGGEMNDWPALPGVGYRVHKGDRIRITTMFHNPTDESYSDVVLKVRMQYVPAVTGEELKSVYPAWFDVKECGNSDFDIPAAGLTLSGSFTLAYPGHLLGVGGHLHDYGTELVLQQPGAAEPIAILKSQLDPQGHIVSMPVMPFLPDGIPLAKGNRLKVTASYEPPKEAHAQGMGIVVGYFLPDTDQELAGLARKAARP